MKKKKNVPIRLVNEASSSDEDEKAGTVTIKLDDKSDVELTKFGGGNTEQTVQFILKLHQLFEQNGTTKKMNAANKALDDLLEELDWKTENPPSSTEEDIQTDDSDDEGNPRARITCKVKHDKKVDKLKESIKRQKEKEQVLVLKCLNLVNKLMDSEQSTLFKRLTKEVTNKMDWVDDDGVVHPEKRGLSKKSLELILLEYVLHVCPTDGAEVVREYLQHKIKLGPVSIKALYNRVLQINSYIQYLPCLKDSSFATKDTPRMNVPFNKYELCQVIMRALPERWQTQYDMTHKVIASDPNAHVIRRRLSPLLSLLSQDKIIKLVQTNVPCVRSTRGRTSPMLPRIALSLIPMVTVSRKSLSMAAEAVVAQTMPNSRNVVTIWRRSLRRP